MRPTLDVVAQLGSLSIRTKALIDTGAPRCVFPRGVGDLLGVEFPQLSSEADKSITFLGRRWAAVSEIVTLQLDQFDDDLTWEAEVDFVLEDGLSLGLLGYEGFLNRWAVSFNGAYGYFVIEPADAFADRQDSSLFDDLQRRYPGLT